MKLSDFEYLVKFKYQVFSGTEASDDLSVTDMFLAISGFTSLTNDTEVKTIDDALNKFESDEEKEAYLDKLVWHIPGGQGMSDPKYDIDKDTKLTEEDIKAVEEIAEKDEPTEEEINKADMNKDKKVDEIDVKIIKDNVKSKVKVESNTTNASTAEDVESIENPEDTNLTVDTQEAVDAITGDDYYNNLNIEG